MVFFDAELCGRQECPKKRITEDTEGPRYHEAEGRYAEPLVESGAGVSRFSAKTLP